MPYITNQEMARVLGVHTDTINNWARKAQLLDEKKGRGPNGGTKIPARALLNFLVKTDILPFAKVELPPISTENEQEIQENLPENITPTQNT